MELFEDRERGAFFSAADSGDLVLRLKDDYDGAEPSGNSAMATALVRLSRMTGRDDFRASADRTLATFRGQLKQSGAQVPQMLSALAMNMAPPVEIVLSGAEDDPGMNPMLAAIRRRFLPNAVVLLARDAPHPIPVPAEGVAAYVCANFTCRLPVTDPEKLDEQLG